ncbi:MAG: alpha-1,4-glucan--maltose-1-phosphate maltosyltransferase [Dehalococcoidia bacterium]
MLEPKHRRTVIIDNIEPEVDGGAFPAKRIAGDQVVVEANVFADGHDAISALLLYRRESQSQWNESAMEPLGNDRWRASFTVDNLEPYRYTIKGWVDPFFSWLDGFVKKVEAGQDVSVELMTGTRLISEAAERAGDSDDGNRLRGLVGSMNSPELSDAKKASLLSGRQMKSLLRKYPDRQHEATYPAELRIWVEREKARFSTWYEMFPRSCSPDPERHGTFKDCENRLPYIASMGFDVLYLPPIHPIGNTHRKSRNNVPGAGPGDPGSPWAIGSPEGGHKSIHPELGTMEDFHHLLAKAAEYSIEVALDIAFHCSPDHPYVQEHPEWFRKRPDGSIQYAENPPKKYQDIYPLDFETDHWRDLWEELKSIVEFWIDQGIRIFRVDNPHTKPFPFWEWLIPEIKKRNPEVIMLSEAFTRPKVMYRLAKLGFTQSYTYFAWRNIKQELTDYFTELTQTGVRDFFRPHLWPNTPDILTDYLQVGGRPAFMTRLILAATLGSNYGIYGPAYELGINAPREPGSEEYLDSEKYEIKHWDIDAPHNLKDFIALVNLIRRENPALRQDWNLEFHTIENDEIMAYTRKTDDLANIILTVVNLDPHHTQSGWVEVPIDELGLDQSRPYQVHDLLTGSRYLWHGRHNYVELNPEVVPAHILRFEQIIRSEADFDYYT